MAWNLIWEYSLISHPIHYNFSGNISKTKPFLTTQPWFITKGDILWVWHRFQCKKSGIVELEQSWCTIQLGCQQRGNSDTKEQQTIPAESHNASQRMPQTWLAPFFCDQPYQNSYLSPSSPHVFPCACDYRLLSWAFSVLSIQSQQARLITPIADCSKKKKRSCLSIWLTEME